MRDNDHGIAVLYDAILSAIRVYTLNSNLISSLNLPTRHSEMDDENLFLLIKSSGMIDESISIDDFQYVVRITEDALNFRTKQKDIHGFIKRIENILSQLEILPLNERELPQAESKII